MELLSEVATKDVVKVCPNSYVFVDVLNITNFDGVKSIAVTDVSGRLVKTVDDVDFTNQSSGAEIWYVYSYSK